MEFRLLGALEVRDGGRRVALGAGRQRALLAILLLHANEVVASDRLVEELWAERPPESARKGVQVYVFRLRRALGAERIRTRPSGYLLAVEPDELDVQRFERLVQEAGALRAGGEEARAAAALREALGLWDGPALTDFTYEQFAQTEIARLEELRLSALEERIDADLRLGHGADLVGELEALVAEHPFRERLRGQTMLALYRAGRQAEALAAYQQTRKLLVEELGIEPSPALQGLEAAILRQEPELEPPAHVEAPPRPSEPAREVRKTVTVAAFGIAEAGGALDPEARRRLRRSLAAAVSHACARHGGQTVGTGEGLVTVFGLPAVHEDDALRALRAAAELREHELPLRAGIETGEVVVAGEKGGEDLLATEVAENAVRLRDTAERNEIVLGEATRRLLGESARVEPAAAGWRVLELVPGAPALGAGAEAPLVGRGEELAQLRGILARTVHERMPHLVTVLGPAGIGKSRLAREFAALVGAEASVVSGRCLPYGEGITFWPLREIVQQAAGEVTRESVFELHGGEDAPLVADRLTAALGLAEKSVASEEEIFWAVRRLLETLAEERPLVVVFEDLHWAEATLLDLVEHLSEWARDAPLLFLCLARPDLLEARPRWGGGTPNAASLRLEPLGAEESHRLVDELPGGRELPEATSERLLAAGEGNPLFLEQLLALVRDGAQPGDELGIPPTIAALLAARLDRLGPGERAVLEAAAVVGRDFSPDALVELLPEQARAAAPRHLEALARRQFVRPLRAPGGREPFRFGHILIQQAAYRAIPKEVRAGLHERFAAWLVETAGAQVGELDEIVGYHLEQAFRYHEELGPIEERARGLARQAAERLGAAGGRALARWDMPAAANLLGRAVALREVGDPARLELLPDLGAALHEGGEYARAEQVLGEAIAEGAAAGDRRAELLALLERCSARLWSDPDFELEEAEGLAKRAVSVFEELGDEAGLAKGWTVVAAARLHRGLAGGSLPAWEAALEHAQRAGNHRMEADAVGGLALALLLGPTPVPQAATRLQEVGGETRELTLVRAILLVMGGVLAAMPGRFDVARERIARSRAVPGIDLGRLMGAPQGIWLGSVELLAGEPEAAEATLRPWFEALAQMGQKGAYPTVATMLAEAVYQQGRYDEAKLLTRRSQEVAGADDVVSQVGWRRVRAKVLAREGATEDGERLAREALSLADATEMPELRGDAAMTLGEVLALAGRQDEAAEALAEATELYEAKGIVVLAARTRALLEEARRRSFF